MNAVETIFGRRYQFLTGGFVDTILGVELRAEQIRREVLRRREALSASDLAPGHVVAIWPSPPTAFVTNYLAALGLGLIVVPFDPGQPPEEQARRATLVGASMVLADIAASEHDWADGVDLPVHSLQISRGAHLTAGGTPAPSYPRDIAQVLFTSGSVGISKAAMISHAGLVSNARATIHWGQLTHGDLVAGMIPLFHCYAILHTLLAPLRTGARVLALGRFSVSAAIEAFSQHPVTVIPAVPAMFEMMLRDEGFHRITWSGLRFACSGGAVLRGSTQEDFLKRTNAPLLNAYGLTEATSFVAAPPVRMRNQQPRSIGWPVRGVQCRLSTHETTGVGELEVRGPAVMAGYLDDPSATAQSMTIDGWLRTGDKVEIKGDGEIFYGGRLKSLINRGGEKVHPEAIEEVLGTVPWARGVVAAGVPDEVLGERIVCVVEATEADFVESDLRSVAAARLGSHLRPDSYVRVDALPRTPTGKLRRAEAELLAVRA